MTGPIGLHGGGEYVAGDERYLDALLEAAHAARAGHGRGAAAADSGDLDVVGHALAVDIDTTRIVILPTAAARGRPDRTSATGRNAFERRAAVGRRQVIVEVAAVVDAASAADTELAARIEAADLIHLPGGDPDLVPAILGGSAALAAIRAAHDRGAVVAGASAGAMALAEWTWTPDGGTRGLGLVHGLAVVPHYDDVRRTAWQAKLDLLAPGGIGYLGLDEQTGVISEPSGSGGESPGRAWRVAGAGAAHWFARGAAVSLTGRDGDVLRLPV